MKLSLVGENFNVEFLEINGNLYLSLILEEDICSSPNSYSLSGGAKLFVHEDIFCGLRIPLEKVGRIKSIENIYLVDEFGYEIDLSTFIEDFIS